MKSMNDLESSAVTSKTEDVMCAADRRKEIIDAMLEILTLMGGESRVHRNPSQSGREIGF